MVAPAGTRLLIAEIPAHPTAVFDALDRGRSPTGSKRRTLVERRRTAEEGLTIRSSACRERLPLLRPSFLPPEQPPRVSTHDRRARAFGYVRMEDLAKLPPRVDEGHVRAIEQPTGKPYRDQCRDQPAGMA